MTLAAHATKTALVTGAAGVMGKRLVHRLLGAGWRVRALVLPGDREGTHLAQAGCVVHEGDVADASSLRGIAQSVDTVYHLAAIILSHDASAFARVNLQGTANVVAAAQAGAARHFIYVSSASVTYPELTLYGQSKLAAEKVVTRAQGLAHTIVRPTLVYERGGGQELMLFLRYLQRFPVVPFIGRGAARKRPVWADDVVDGLFRLAGHPAAPGKLYNFSGGEVITMYDLARLLLELAGTPRPILPIPVSLCMAAARALAWVSDEPPLTTSAIAGIIHDADLSPALAMHELGYHPIGVREGLPRCFAASGAARLESEKVGVQSGLPGRFGLSPSKGSIR